MVRDRLFAVLFRGVASGVILAGLVVGSGFVAWPRALLFYTTQSNIAVLAFFVYLTARTSFDLVKKGRFGCACYSPRLSMALMVFISFTLIIFWAVLAPFLQKSKLWTFGNLSVHALAPALMILEHILFCTRGHAKKHDVFLFALIPLSYVILSSTLGFCKIVCYYTAQTPHYFPYPFMDFSRLGAKALIPIAIVATAYMGFTKLLIRMDGR